MAGYMAEILRLFIAIEPPEQVVDWLHKFQARLVQLDTAEGFRWGAIDGVHLTLKFLGDSPTEQRPQIEDALCEAVQSIESFTLSLDTTNAGIFTARGALPNIVWVGAASDPVSRLTELQQAVERAISPLGYPADSRRFTPHLTLARARTNASRTQLMTFVRHFDALRESLYPKLPDDEITWQVSAVNLIRSDLRPGGAVYTSLAECALSGCS